jgi:hypothetical protein
MLSVALVSCATWADVPTEWLPTQVTLFHSRARARPALTLLYELGAIPIYVLSKASEQRGALISPSIHGQGSCREAQ